MSDIKKLEKKATELRKDIVTMICKSKSGHPGGSLSVIDIMTALYYDVMNIDVANPQKEDRDRGGSLIFVYLNTQIRSAQS